VARQSYEQVRGSHEQLGDSLAPPMSRHYTINIPRIKYSCAAAAAAAAFSTCIIHHYKQRAPTVVAIELLR